MTKIEQKTKDSETEKSSVENDVGKKSAMLEIYGKRADSIEEELKAWSEILAEREERFKRKKSFFGGWRKSKGSRPRFLKRRKR